MVKNVLSTGRYRTCSKTSTDWSKTCFPHIRHRMCSKTSTDWSKTCFPHIRRRMCSKTLLLFGQKNVLSSGRYRTCSKTLPAMCQRREGEDSENMINAHAANLNRTTKSQAPERTCGLSLLSWDLILRDCVLTITHPYSSLTSSDV